jgi:hypothetical protein
MTDCSTNYRPVLSSERAPQDEEQSNCREKEREINLVIGPRGVPDTKTDRPTDRLSHQLSSVRVYPALRRVGILVPPLYLCDEKGTSTPGVYRAILFLGDNNTRTSTSRLRVTNPRRLGLGSYWRDHQQF